jgi:hypothetical protein
MIVKGSTAIEGLSAGRVPLYLGITLMDLVRLANSDYEQIVCEWAQR